MQLVNSQPLTTARVGGGGGPGGGGGGGTGIFLFTLYALHAAPCRKDNTHKIQIKTAACKMFHQLHWSLIMPLGFPRVCVQQKPAEVCG